MEPAKRKIPGTSEEKKLQVCIRFVILGLIQNPFRENAKNARVKTLVGEECAVSALRSRTKHGRWSSSLSICMEGVQYVYMNTCSGCLLQFKSIPEKRSQTWIINLAWCCHPITPKCSSWSKINIDTILLKMCTRVCICSAHLWCSSTVSPSRVEYIRSY